MVLRTGRSVAKGLRLGHVPLGSAVGAGPIEQAASIACTVNPVCACIRDSSAYEAPKPAMRQPHPPTRIRFDPAWDAAHIAMHDVNRPLACRSYARAASGVVAGVSNGMWPGLVR